jgi:hypothetical protein
VQDANAAGEAANGQMGAGGPGYNFVGTPEGNTYMFEGIRTGDSRVLHAPSICTRRSSMATVLSAPGFPNLVATLELASIPLRIRRHRRFRDGIESISVWVKPLATTL